MFFIAYIPPLECKHHKDRHFCLIYSLAVFPLLRAVLDREQAVNKCLLN